MGPECADAPPRTEEAWAVPRRLVYRPSPHVWIAVLLTAALFVIALALALTRVGTYDSTAPQVNAGPVVAAGAVPG